MAKIEKISSSDTLNTGREKINTAIDALVNSSGNTVNVGFTESFDTLTALKSKYPSGKDGMFFVFDNGSGDGGHSFMWVDDAWKDLGIYQGKEIADNTVTPIKIADSFDYLTSAKIQENKYIELIDSDGFPQYTQTANYWTAEIKVPEKGKLQFKKSAWAHGRAFAFLDANGKAIISFPYGLGSLFNYLFAKDGNSFIEFDCEHLKQTFPNLNNIVFEFRIEDRGLAYIIGAKTVSFDDYQWGRLGDFKHLENIPNTASDYYDLIKRPDTEFIVNQQAISVDTTTKNVTLSNIDSVSTYLLNIPNKGTLEFPKYTLSSRYFIILLRDDKTYVQTLNYNYTTGASSWPWLHLETDVFVIDVHEMRKQFNGIKYAYLAVPNNTIKNGDFKVKAEGAYALTEIYSYITPESQLDVKKELVLVKKYPIVEGETGYIYLDNLDLNGNYYNDKDMYIAQTTNNDTISGGFPIEMGSSDVNVPISRISNDGMVIDDGSIKCISVPKTAGSGQTPTIMLIGESTTEDTTFSVFLNQKFEEDVLKPVFVGTRGSTVKHEGRGGWSTEQLIYSAEYNGKTNSFYNPSTSKFDYAYYRAQNPSITIPDLITIHFGINDPNQGISADRTIENIDFIINQFKVANPNIKVVVGLTTNLCRIENVAYRTLSRRNNILKTTKALIEKYQDHESENIFLNPMYLTLDPIWDMRYEERQINKYNPKTTLYATDGTHPSLDIGYHKTADCTYNAIKYVMSK